MNTRQDRAKTLFLRALEIASEQERLAFVQEQAAQDQPLRAEVEELLRHHGQIGSFLQTPALELDRTQRLGARPASRSADEIAPERTEIELGFAEAERVSLHFLSPSDNPEELGRLGPYGITGVVGCGGMGVVLKGFDDKLHRVVAIKVLAPWLASSATARRRFIREAQAAAAVRNEHVIGIHAVEETNNPPYLVMEYVSGISLQERLDQTGPLEIREILRIGMQAAAGLAAAHAQGLIHRDIKPANILLENSVERVKITDFGLARAAHDVSLTQSGVVAGTPQYMAPEQARGDAIDHRADLFSLGSVLYAMCTARPPFSASTTVAVLRRVSDDAAAPIHEFNPEAPEWLVVIIEELMAKDPAERFSSATEVAELLGRFLAHLQQPLAVPPPDMGLLAGGGHRGVGVPPVERRKRQSRRMSRRRWLAAAAALLILSGSVGLTEATGVTHMSDFVGTVLRIRTSQGTLILEVDDPDVQVAIEGNGEHLAISGAGIERVQLSPGRYQVRACKDGRAVREELVTITRGDKQVVRVSLEENAGASLEPAGQPQTPDDALARGEVRRFSHELVYAAVLSGDGRRAVSGGWDKTVRLWDVETGRELHRFKLNDSHYNHAVYCVAVSPDGLRALAGSRHGTTWMFDLERGSQLGACDYPRTGARESLGVTSVAFSPDGQRALLGTFDGVVRVWDLGSWKELSRLATTKGLWSVAFSPSGSYVLIAGGKGIKGEQPGLVHLWDLQTGKEIQTLTGHTDGVWQAVFSPDGRYALSASLDLTVRLWDLQTGKELRQFIGHSSGVMSVDFSDDGRYFVSGGGDKTVRRWDVATGRELERFEGHTAEVRSVDYSPDGRHVLSAAADGTLRLWQLAGDDGAPPKKKPNK